MSKLIAFLLFVGMTLGAEAQSKKAYQLYNSKGKKVSYKKMIKTMSKSDIVLFGEHHNNPIIHWLQYEATDDLFKSKKLTLGAEMFEADNQLQLNEYISGKIDQKAFDTVARLWKNYPTDYKPLVDFAKNNSLNFVATNVPRRYASMVFKGGFESLDILPSKEKEWIAPLPIAYDSSLPGYVKMLEMMGGHGGDNLPKAQAVKDATMAHFILQHQNDGELFIHYNGSYHSDDYEGINWYLNKNKSGLNIVTVSVLEQDDISKFNKEEINQADFIIVVPTTMTKTY